MKLLLPLLRLSVGLRERFATPLPETERLVVGTAGLRMLIDRSEVWLRTSPTSAGIEESSRIPQMSYWRPAPKHEMFKDALPSPAPSEYFEKTDAGR